MLKVKVVLDRRPGSRQARQGLGGLAGLAIVVAALAAASVVTLGVFKQGNPASLAEVPRRLLPHLRTLPQVCVMILLLLDTSKLSPMSFRYLAPMQASVCSSTPPAVLYASAICLSATIVGLTWKVRIGRLRRQRRERRA